MKIEVKQGSVYPVLLVDGEVVAIPQTDVWSKFDNEVIDTREKADRFIWAWRRDCDDLTAEQLDVVHLAHKRALNRHYPNRGGNRIGEGYAETMWR